MRILARAAVVGAVLTLSSCVSVAPSPFEGSARAEARSISVYAKNENAEDVVIYVLSVGGIERLGMVAPDHTEIFFLNWEGSRELRVRVEILAGPHYTTNALPTVEPGDGVEVWVPSRASRSFIRRR